MWINKLTCVSEWFEEHAKGEEASDGGGCRVVPSDPYIAVLSFGLLPNQFSKDASAESTPPPFSQVPPVSRVVLALPYDLFMVVCMVPSTRTLTFYWLKS